MADIPIKFQNADGSPNVDNMVQSIAELERMMAGRPPVQPGAPMPGQPPAQGAIIPGQQGQPAPMTAEALRPFLLEHVAHGQLSPSSIQVMHQVYGVQPAHAPGFISGMVSEAHQRQASILANSGYTADQYKAAHGWAQQALSPDQRASFLSSLDGPDPNVASQSIQWLVGQHQAAQAGPAPTQVIGENTVPVPPVEQQMTSVQMQEAMKNPLYQTDKAFHDDVAQKVMASEALGETLKTQVSDTGAA